MEDKEVGELWVIHQSSVVGDLIRKLVEERAWRVAAKYYHIDTAVPPLDSDEVRHFMKAALRDFGIDAATFDKP